MLENIETAEVPDGYLVLDLNIRENVYELTIEYPDGDVLELEVLHDFAQAMKAFKKCCKTYKG